MIKGQFKLSDKAIEELLDLEIEVGIFKGNREEELKKRLNDNKPVKILFGG
jgi:hypothetical protein